MTVKEHILDELNKLDTTVLSLAYLHAKNLSRYGVNILEAWTTATENAANLEKAYQLGYKEGYEAAFTSSKQMGKE